jgi:cytochrome c oxidase subunit 1/cytochrome c oxidase subunit I+III
MAVTETPPETVAAASEKAQSAPRPQPTGLAAVLGSGDHKTIGRLYIVTSLLFGVVVAGLAGGFALESTKPSTLDVFTKGSAFQLFTLMRVGEVFLLALPLVVGVALVVVPLQVGARSVAFPRAAAASYWAWLLGAVLLVASYLADGGPGGDRVSAVRLWIAALGLIIVALLTAAVSLATTVFALRTPGMGMDRVPLYSWSVATAAVLWLLTLPVLFGHLVLAYVDNRHGTGQGIGAASSLYARMGWVLRNPAVYVVAIPVLGFALDAISTTVKARISMRSVAQGAIAAFATVSFGAFLAIPSKDALESPFTIALALIAVAPLLAVLLTAGDAIRRGTFRLTGGLLYGVAGLVVLLVGVAAGALGAIPGVLDAPGKSTVADNILYLGVGNAAVLAAVIASLGGVHWWSAKVGRRLAPEGLGMLAPVVLLIGALLAVLPDIVSGIAGDGAELVADYTGGIKGLNVVTTGGVAIVIVGLVLAIASLVPLFRSAPQVPSDPWDGQTLEWLAPSPPPVGNFAGELAVVTSAEPLIDLREEK